MNVVRIGDLSQQIRGVSYDKAEASKQPATGLVPVLRANNIDDGEINLIDLVYVPSYRVRSQQFLKAGDVLIAASSGSIDVVGKAAPIRKDLEAGFGAFCKVLRPSKQVWPPYFAHYFQTKKYRQIISGLAAGANINNLKNEHLDNLEIPLPPLPEQRRIAAVLDAADALRAKRRAALGKLGALLQSVFLEMFGDPVRNEKGWVTKPLGQLMTEVYRYPTYYDIAYEADGIPEIRGELINDDGSIDSNRSRLRYISPLTSARFPRTVLLEDDLVMSVRGTIGKVGRVPSVLAGGNITANLIRMSPDRKVIEPGYAWYFLRSEYFKNQLIGASSSTTIQTIRAPDLKAILVILPPLSMQRVFVQQANRIEKMRAQQQVWQIDIDRFFASLQQRAFRGEL